MTAADILDQLRALPPAERMEIVGRIWDEFADDDLALTAEQAAELDRRTAELTALPQKVIPWDAIKAATKAKHGTRP